MPAPTLTDTAERLYDGVAPLATQDAQYGFALAWLCAGFARMIDSVAAIVRDGTDGSPGWSQVFDVANVDASWLPWLAQFVGVNLTGVTEITDQRAAIPGHTGFNRGSLEAIEEVVQATLTGTKTVHITTFVNGSPWELTINTIPAETPNTTATALAMLSQLPAWMTVNAQVTVLLTTYSELPAHQASYTAQAAAHATYLDLRNNP